MQVWNIAHRGGAQLMPENTLAAFAEALARGCDGVELDVQLTRDGTAVVHHDFA
jgi:glycerophosphoryl diester phosphodiesterase